MFRQVLRRLARRRDGSVSVIGAVSIPFLIAMVGMVAEYGNGLEHKVENQRIADAAAFAAATSYNANSGNSMSSVVNSIAAMNGIQTTNISEAIVTSPSGDGNQAIQVTVTTQAPLLLSQVLGNTTANLTVTATSYAEMKGGEPGCIIALASGGTGVTLSGGTSVSASACAIASDNTVTVPCGTTITSIAVDYNSASAPSEPCTGIVAPSGKTLTIKKTSTTDPLSGDSNVATATARLTTVAAMTSPSGPSGVPAGASVAYGYGAVTVPSGCTDSWNGATKVHTTTCTGNGPFNFGSLTTSGGLNVNIGATGSSPTFNFSGSINMTATTLTFGGGTYNIAGGIQTGGGTVTSFGAGTFNIGKGSFSCNGSTGYSICNTGTSLTFGGPSTFVTAGGIYDSGGETLTLGSGASNSFNIGKANDGNSFNQGGGATTKFADATGVGDVFQMAGNLNVGSGGGSCLVLSAATQHDINGFLSSAGGTVMGAGIYTVNAYFALGANGGGEVSCNGQGNVGLYGNGVTLVIGAASTPGSGTCSGLAFCMAAGYADTTLIAPASGSTANLAVIGPLSGSHGASLAEGASGADFSGAFYFPTESVTMSGGSSLGSFGANQCLMLIGSQVSLTGGATLASSCAGIGGGTTSSVVLVQ